MVLVDTSIWIQFLTNRTANANELDRLLAANEVYGHQLVYGELLIGDKGGRASLLATYKQFRQAPLIAHNEVVEFVRHRRLHGRGAGWIDIHLLASALVSGLRLWTADPRLNTLAEELSIAYHGPYR